MKPRTPRRKKAIPLTARTKTYLEKLGWQVGLVERYNPYCRQRFDLFGFIDQIAMSRANQIVGVQATSHGHLHDHLQKVCIDQAKNVHRWLRCNGYVLLVGWALRAQRDPSTDKVLRGSRKTYQPLFINVVCRKGILRPEELSPDSLLLW